MNKPNHYCGYCGDQITSDDGTCANSSCCPSSAGSVPTDSELLSLAYTLEKLSAEKLAMVAGQCFALIKSKA